VALGKTPEEKVAEDRRKLSEREAHQQDCERRLAVREARPRRSAEAAQATKVAKAEGSLEEELPGIASAINQETSALNTGSGGAVPARDNTEEAREVTRGDQNFPKVIAAVEVIAARGAGVYLLDLGNDMDQTKACRFDSPITARYWGAPRQPPGPTAGTR